VGVRKNRKKALNYQEEKDERRRQEIFSSRGRTVGEKLVRREKGEHRGKGKKGERREGEVKTARNAK